MAHRVGFRRAVPAAGARIGAGRCTSTWEVAMKRRVLIDLSVVIVLCAALMGCEKNIQAARELATAVAQEATAEAQATADARLLAQQVADALGRTPANSIFE